MNIVASGLEQGSSGVTVLVRDKFSDKNEFELINIKNKETRVRK